MRLRPLALALAAAILAAPLAGAAPLQVTPDAYILQLEVDPAQGSIRVTGQVIVVRQDLNASTVAFALHQTLAIEQLLVNGYPARLEYRALEPRPTMPAAREVVVTIPELARETHLRIELAYGGRLATAEPLDGPEAARDAGRLDDSVGPRRIELASYSAWYPVFAPFGATFAAELTVILPASWTMVCTGERQPSVPAKVGAGRRFTAARATDLNVIAAPDLKRVPIERAGAAVEIYHTSLPDPFIARESDNARRTLELYQQLLGEPSNRSATVRVVYSPRAGGQAGYARPPLIVLSEGLVRAALQQDPRLSLLRGTAHEAAHFWWNFGTDQGDWINESLSEYFGLLAVERIDSPEQYARAIVDVAERVNALPPDAPSLAEVPAANEGHGYTVRYYKGALMLHELRRAMGDGAFFDACRGFFQARRGRSTATENFRAFWSARLGEHAALLESWLTSRGGVPDEATATSPLGSRTSPRTQL